jgi:hypothetical protein
MDRERTVLRFARGENSVALGLVGLLAAGASLYFAAEYAFGHPAERHGGSYSGIDNFFRDGHEWMGVLVFLGFAWLFGRGTILWLWGAFTKQPAAELTGDRLRIHRAFGRRTAIAYDTIEQIDVRDEGNARWFGLLKPILRLRITARDRKLVVRSVMIDGGGEALEAFAAELEARRKMAAMPDLS